MSVKSLSAALLLLASGFLVSSGAFAGETKTSKIDINFAQTYTFVQCPSSAPVGDGCLNVTGVSDQRETGRISFSRLAMFNPAQFDPNHPTCLTIETAGTLTLPRGTLTFHAPGNVCFTEGIASYDLIVTGGTGTYEGALGGGKIIVSPPDSGSTGRELWHLELFQNDRNEYRFY